MLNKNIIFNNKLIYKKNNLSKKIKKNFIDLKNDIYSDKIPMLNSFKKNFKLNYDKKIIKKLKNKNIYNIIGMGGSILGSKTIYSFLKHKIKKIFKFIDNLDANNFSSLSKDKKQNNIFISKSGNTIETMVNLNFIIKRKNLAKNTFVTEFKNSALLQIANKLKSEIIEHKDYIGGRYSVMSEVGMLPAELMNLKTKNFKNLNYLINNKNFSSSLISNVSSIYSLFLSGKKNSIILNYDTDMHDFCLWYQQLVGESLGKNNKGILPIISTMPKDNHSLLQYYLDGPKNSFFTFFSTKHSKNFRIKNLYLSKNFQYLKNKNLEKIVSAQKLATQNVFLDKKISYRSFHILKKNEEELGTLFTFFVLETILLAKLLKVNPFDQPAVELIKKETTKILNSN